MINWQQIDTVLLDMDGTLLDLHFDNFFWLEHLPRRYAEIHELDESTAAAHLHELIRRRRGTLEWYCLEHWSEALSVDVRKLKEEIKDKIQIRPHVEDFLTRLRQLDKKLVLITNAHPQSLSLKLDVTAIDRWLDIVISSHEFKEPKEVQAFWHALREREHFDPARTLFIDDTTSVLESAKTYGIGHLLCIHQPDSKTSRTVEGYPAIHHFDEIMPPGLLGR
ncbi:GMP/IMP nucleotidase [Marinimicrobium sp. ABcell2]|uniref:GMP/IMP nucleotidase n=1 Tax=Marinimicrobium sp. ABcell2 TaxID=3069751 RepID=UPI0027AE83D1|nr:GMP/IMP nucleotidase [Marinimicrobium sp. ABcell2]MDQ2076060.1 GMP/IMP nucleotidase [Marinimicrobium sp. ABcell2]